MNLIRPLFIACLFWISIANMAIAQVEKIKAAYIYNFATMTNYPTSFQSGDFVIAVVGIDPISAELEAIAKAKKVGSQAIVIKKINSVAEIGNAHMVYIPDNQKSKLSDFITKTASTPTVVITESAGACSKGAIFNLLLIDQKMRFEVNEGKANAKGVKLAANLVKLGIPVN